MDNFGTLDDALAKWDAGESVWTIEMGGLGPGYEQCIQIGAFELAKRLRGVTLPDAANDDALRDALHEHLRALCKEVPAMDGISGAQAGAMLHIAYNFVKHGYDHMMQKVPKDRLIQCSKSWPKAA